MSDTEHPQIYLITPPAFTLQSFRDDLAAVLDAHAVACVRLSMASQDASEVSRTADALREVTHARDVAIVIDSHIALVEKLGLDGVHLPDGSRNMRATRKELGADAIVGAFCGASRHDGMNAAEAGADYISFGPVASDGLGDGTLAETDLFAWWSEVIEVPVVAEGGLDVQTIAHLAPMTDFFGIGTEIWGKDDPAAELAKLIAAF